MAALDARADRALHLQVPMQSPLAWLRRRAFHLDGASARRALGARASFEPERLAVLDQVIDAFVHGYNAALEPLDERELAARLDALEPRWRGFAFEGAAMALWMLDSTSLRPRDRWARFVAGGGAAHAYMLYVGAGWAIERLHQDWERRTAALDPVLRWLALDGCGFHAGFFHAQRYLREHAAPRGLAAPAAQVFDQGLGRSLWFAEGAEVERAIASASAFPPARRADVWSGLGLACAYAGGASERETARLLSAAGEHRAEFAQGVAFAATSREHARIRAEHTSAVCKLVWRRDPEQVAAIVERARQTLGGGESSYATWRRCVRREFQSSEVGRVTVG